MTGNPITFSTDLANIAIPRREHVQLVDTSSYGNVQVERDRRLKSVTGHGLALESMATPTMASYGSTANISNCMMQEASGTANLDVFYSDQMEPAEAPGVDSKDVGDFCVFTNKERLSIPSKRSAVVPMFTVTLSSAGSVLLYKAENHPRRPWRAVKFKNESTYSLGRGKVVICQDGIFAGEAVLEATKPGENRMLPHCLENGVRVIKESRPSQETINSIRLSKGIVYSEHAWTAVTEYEIENRKEEEFNLLVEHENQLRQPEYAFEGGKVSEYEKLSNGVRAYLVLPPKGKMALSVKERAIDETRLALEQSGQTWLRDTILSTKHPLSNNNDVQQWVHAQTRIDKFDEDIKTLEQTVKDLVEETSRTRENIKATMGDVGSSSIKDEWVKDLDKAEKEIRRINKEDIPQLRVKRKEAKDALGKMLKELTVQWSASTESKVLKELGG